MPSVYLITEHDCWGKNDLGWYHHFDNIRELQPDIVILWLAFEFGLAQNWYALPQALNNWLLTEKPKTKVFLFAPDIFNSVHGELDGIQEIQKCIFTMVTFMNIGSYGKNIHNNKPISETFYKTNLNAEKFFVTMNQNPKLHRMLLLDRLFELNLQDKCVYSSVNFDGRASNLPYKFFPKTSKILTPSGNKEIEGGCDIPLEYHDGFIDLVTETCYEENAFFPTEKTIRPLMMLKPFIAISCPHYHTKLADNFGIQLYTEMFDYNYVDSIQDLKKRTHAVLDQVIAFEETFNSVEKKKQVLEKISPKLLHNANKIYHYSASYNVNAEFDNFFDQLLTSGDQLVVHTSSYDNIENLFSLWMHPYAEAVCDRTIKPNHNLLKKI